MVSRFFNIEDELPYIVLIVLIYDLISALLLKFVLLACINSTNCIPFNPETIVNSLFLFNTVFFLVVCVKTLQELTKIIKINNNYSFSAINWPDGWIYNGQPEIKDGDLHITSSRAGLLFQKMLWKNCEISFELKFDKNLYPKQVVGIIFRAKDLDNYFMLEIRGDLNDSKDSNTLCPHIRYKSGWEALRLKRFDFFNFQEFKKINISIFDNTVDLSYEGRNIYQWILPTHVDIHHFEAGVDSGEKKEDPDSLKNIFKNHVQRISFRNNYGMIGFRAHYDQQGGIIRNLKVFSK